MWFKVDDRLPDHPKIRRLSPRSLLNAIGLWTLCGAWAGRNETDGFIPRTVVRQFDAKYRTAHVLVDAGLWHEVEHEGEPGWRFHDWSHWQPTAADLREIRRSKAEAGRLGGVRSGQSRRSKHEAGASARASSKPEANTNPEPEPEPLATDVASRRPRERGTARGTRLPADFTVTPEMVAWARENAPDVDGRAQTAVFIDYWRAKAGAGGTKLDWLATWRNWMRRAQEDAARPRNGHARPEPTRAQQWLDLARDDVIDAEEVPARKALP